MSEISVNLSMLKSESAMFGKISKDLQHYGERGEKVMNKRRGLCSIIIIVLFVSLIMQGCSKKTSIDETQIREIEILYEQTTDIYNKVNIDFENGTKTTKVYGDKEQENEEIFTFDNAFKLFIKDNILTDDVAEKQQDKNSDTMKLMWSIRIWVGEEHYDIEGFEGEEYPVYWNELLEYMEIDV